MFKKKIQTATLYPSRVNKKQIKKLTLQTVQKGKKRSLLYKCIGLNIR